MEALAPFLSVHQAAFRFIVVIFVGLCVIRLPAAFYCKAPGTCITFYEGRSRNQM